MAIHLFYYLLDINSTVSAWDKVVVKTHGSPHLTVKQETLITSREEKKKKSTSQTFPMNTTRTSLWWRDTRCSESEIKLFH